ncbi:Anaphase-promoting complex subunit 6 [Carpediemonas membranifera]|uniref:Anaphase-promoting complex subunit 6 n=1 Tax=Carpediemonas membranifera TaxID=201153 RepID=A0A8J6E467_9EUKA|nr:Anaphase-promoting complex subunit 6 [Carpediemonas membranifera]|eukprot:KAG9396833.1 Anaphase-promoting complex subunit 6 [Carpediemonas membranifera]
MAEQLRNIIKASVPHRIEKSGAAMFFADQLMCLSSDPADIKLFIKAHINSNDYANALETLKKHNMQTHDLECLYYNALCLKELGREQQCKSFLGTSYTRTEIKARGVSFQPDSDEAFLMSRLCLLRAQTLDVQGLNEHATQWYFNSLEYDNNCTAAILALFGSSRLPLSDRVDATRAIGTSAHPFVNLFVQASVENTSALEALARSHYAQSTDVLVALTRAELANYDFDAAQKLAEKAFEQKPGSTSVIEVLVPCYVALNNTIGLHRVATTLQDLKPDEAIAWHATGSYYTLAQQYNKAMPYLSRAIELSPGYGPALLALGKVHSRLEQSDEAIDKYQAAVTTMTGSPVPLLCLGIEHIKLGRLGSARKLFTRAQQQTPSDPHIQYQLGITEFLSGDMSAARAYLQRVVEDTAGRSQPTVMHLRHQAMVHLGHIYRRTAVRDGPEQRPKTLSDAEAAYRLALRLEPKSHNALAGLAMCLSLEGDNDSAARLVMNALDQAPSYAPYISLFSYITSHISAKLGDLPPAVAPPAFPSSRFKHDNPSSASFHLSHIYDSANSGSILGSASGRTPMLRTPMIATPGLQGSGLLSRGSRGTNNDSRLSFGTMDSFESIAER